MKLLESNLNRYVSITIFLLSLNCVAQESGAKFSRNEVLEDLSYLRMSLEDAHYDLYAYTTKDEFDKNYNQVKTSITKDSLTLLHTTSLLQRVISATKNGHTEIDFPGVSYKAYALNNGTIFPMEIAFENTKAFVRKNFSNNHEIHIGGEIISINGLSMNHILSKIYPQISAERIYFKNAKIEMYSFPRLYWQVFGEVDSFKVEIKERHNINEYHLNAVNLIQDYEMKRDEVLNAKKSLKFVKKGAYLNPGDFSGNTKDYQKFIDSSFTQIKNKKIKNLIIDLRNNKGGDNSFSDYLVSYIANKPFRWNSRFTLKTSKFLKEHTKKNSDTTEVYFQNILAHENGKTYEYQFEPYLPQPKAKRFDGNVYVLVNRQSHSQSAVTAAQIQDYKFGTIVGEETGDYPTLYASQFQYALPNTGILVKVAKGQIVRVNGSKKEEGVIPDIRIKDHLLDEEDEILEGLLKKFEE